MADDVPQEPVNVMSMERFDISTASREELGAYLQQLRTSCGWSIRKIAEQSGLSPATVVNMEAGKFTARLDVLNKYLDVLDAHLQIVTKNKQD